MAFSLMRAAMNEAESQKPKSLIRAAMNEAGSVRTGVVKAHQTIVRCQCGYENATIDKEPRPGKAGASVVCPKCDNEANLIQAYTREVFVRE